MANRVAYQVLRKVPGPMEQRIRGMETSASGEHAVDQGQSAHLQASRQGFGSMVLESRSGRQAGTGESAPILVRRATKKRVARMKPSSCHWARASLVRGSQRRCSQHAAVTATHLLPF